MDSQNIINPACAINLNLSFKNLKVLKDIEKYKNLIELDISGNDFENIQNTCISLKSLSYLKKINIGYNNIDYFVELPYQIETLIINHNNLHELNNNILYLKKLTTLDLSNNYISDISILTNLSSLKYLFLKNNKIKEFGNLANLTKLNELDLENNCIDDLKDFKLFSNHGAIKVLNVNGNPIYNKINFKNLRQILESVLPFSRDGTFSKGYKILKASFIYTNIANCSNQNRSVLVSKSLINSRKQTSPFSDTSDELLNQEEFSKDDDNLSILGSLRCYEDISSLNDKSNNISIDLLRGISSIETKRMRMNNFLIKDIPRKEKSSNEFNSSKEFSPSTMAKLSTDLIIQNKRVNMRLDLSSVLRNNFKSIASSQTSGINISSTGKISPLAGQKNESQLNKTTSFSKKKLLSRISSARPIDTNATTSTTTHPKVPSPGFNTLNSSLINSDHNIMSSNRGILMKKDIAFLIEENENLRNDIAKLRQNQQYMELRMIDYEHLLEDFEIQKKEIAEKKLENSKLLDKLNARDQKLNIKKKEISILKTTLEDQKNKLCSLYNKFLEKGKDSIDPTITFQEMIHQIEEKFKSSKNSIKSECKQRILKQFDQMRDYYRNKQEKLMMHLNDIESRYNFQGQDQIDKLNKELEMHKSNYNKLLQKYTCLRHLCKNKQKSNQKNDNAMFVNINLTNSENESQEYLHLMNVNNNHELKERNDLTNYDNNKGNMIDNRFIYNDDHISDINSKQYNIRIEKAKNDLRGILNFTSQTKCKSANSSNIK